jgi:zinc transporter ZupT
MAHMQRTRQILFAIFVGVSVGVLIGVASGALINSGFRTYGKVLTWSSGLVVAIVVAMMISRRERRDRQ